MLEALICAVGIAANVPAKLKPAVTPPAELLEFIADWREDEAHQFLDPRKGAEKPLPALGGPAHHQTKETGHEH